MLAAVFEKLRLAEDAPLPPSLRAWLAFDGAWLAELTGWFRDPATPSFAPCPVHALVHTRLSRQFAPAFLDLPGKLRSALALPLDQGSETMRMLVLVPRPNGEYPVLTADVDDAPVLGVETPDFGVWLASFAELIRDARSLYAATRERIGAELMDSPKGFLSLDYPDPIPGFGERVRREMREAAERGKALAQSWKSPRKRAGAKTPEVPALAEPEIAQALAEAIESRRAPRIRSFLEQAKARYPDGKTWKSAAIAKAVHTADADLVRELLALGADVHGFSYLENRLVHGGAYTEDADAVLRVLLDAGADLEARGRTQQTPLHDACTWRRVAAVRLLLERGADVAVLDEHQKTPLYCAADGSASARHAENPLAFEICRLLLDAGADPNAVALNEAPLYHAVRWKNLDLARLLVESGADPEWSNTRGQSPLSLARERKDRKMEAVLLGGKR